MCHSQSTPTNSTLPDSADSNSAHSGSAPRRSAIARFFRAPGFWLWLAFFIPTATVYHPRAGWNVNTRLALVFALVDRGTLRIDDYHDLPPYDTGDKALHGGHVYSDKIIGLALLGIPPYAALRLAMAVAGAEPAYHLAHAWTRLWAVSALAALAGLLLWRMFRRLGIGERAAAGLSLAAFYGSLLFPYATVFYPYLPGIFFCLLAWDRAEAWFGGNGGGLDAAEKAPAKTENSAKGARSGWARAFAIGAMLGTALLMDYIFAMAVAAVGLRALWLWSRRGDESNNTQPDAPCILARVVATAIGGAIPLAIFAAYCYAIFGKFTIPYEYEADPLFRAAMAKGFMGVRHFQPAALYYLTIHPYRGLFFWSPLMLVALAGAAWMAWCGGKQRDPDCAGGRAASSLERSAGAMALAVLAAYLVFNASYWQWWGGWAMGPRFLLPAIPFLALGLAGAWKWGLGGRAAVVLAAALSMFTLLPPALSDPQTPMWFHKTEELLTPSVRDNLKPEQALQWWLFWKGEGAPSLGTAMGMSGPFALVPALALFASAVLLALRGMEKSEGMPVDSSALEAVRSLARASVEEIKGAENPKDQRDKNDEKDPRG